MKTLLQIKSISEARKLENIAASLNQSLIQLPLIQQIHMHAQDFHFLGQLESTIRSYENYNAGHCHHLQLKVPIHTLPYHKEVRN